MHGLIIVLSMRFGPECHETHSIRYPATATVSDGKSHRRLTTGAGIVVMLAAIANLVSAVSLPDARKAPSLRAGMNSADGYAVP